QTPSAVLVGVLTRPEGVAAAGGLIVEAMPKARQSASADLERTIAAARDVSGVLEQGGVAALKAACLTGFDPQPLESQAVRYHCRCSRERLLGPLLGLSEEQLEELDIGSEVAQAECGFCGEVYFFQPSELRAPEAPLSPRAPRGPPPSSRQS